MKKLLLILFVFCVKYTYSQAPVTDVAAGAQLSNLNTTNSNLLMEIKKNQKKNENIYKQQLAKQASTFSETKSIKENIDAGLKKIEHVNSYVQNCQQVLNIKNSMSDITKEYSKGISFIINEPLNTGVMTTTDFNKFSTIYKNMILESVSDLKTCMNVINSGFVDMDDASRLAVLDRIEGRLNEKRQLISYLNLRIKTGVAARKTKIANKKIIAKEFFNNSKK